MDETPEWLEEEDDDDADPLEEGEEGDADVPLPEDRRLILICSADQLQCHHLHKVIQLGLGGDNSHSAPPHPQHLLEQLEVLVPPHAHQDHVHDHLLLLEEEWC